MSSFIWVQFVDDFNIPSRSEVLWCSGEDFEKLFLKYMSESHVDLCGSRYLEEKINGYG